MWIESQQNLHYYSQELVKFCTKRKQKVGQFCMADDKVLYFSYEIENCTGNNVFSMNLFIEAACLYYILRNKSNYFR